MSKERREEREKRGREPVFHAQVKSRAQWAFEANAAAARAAAVPTVAADARDEMAAARALPQHAEQESDHAVLMPLPYTGNWHPPAHSVVAPAASGHDVDAAALPHAHAQDLSPREVGNATAPSVGTPMEQYLHHQQHQQPQAQQQPGVAVGPRRAMFTSSHSGRFRQSGC